MCYDRKNMLAYTQNHRIAGVGRGHGRSSSSTPLLKYASSTCAQAGFEYFQRSRLQISQGSLFQHSVTPKAKKFFLIFRLNFLCYSLCRFLLVPSLEITGKMDIAGHILLTPTLRIFLNIDKTLPPG